MARNTTNRHGDGFKHTERPNSQDKQYLKLSFYILNSKEYKTLSVSARAVMQAMQMQHRPHCHTPYGFKQAMAVTGLSDRTVSKSWDELIKNGWLVIIDNYNHSNGKTRTWELTWMSYNGKQPKDLWKIKHVK